VSLNRLCGWRDAILAALVALHQTPLTQTNQRHANAVFADAEHVAGGNQGTDRNRPPPHRRHQVEQKALGVFRHVGVITLWCRLGQDL
jgi:hypothetical protein